MIAAPLFLALAGILAWIFRMIANDSSRADLPRRPGHARPASPRRGPGAGRAHAASPARPAGTAAAVPQTPAAAVPLPLPVETPALYRTDALPALSEHDEGWWTE